MTRRTIENLPSKPAWIKRVISRTPLKSKGKLAEKRRWRAPSLTLHGCSRSTRHSLNSSAQDPGLDARRARVETRGVSPWVVASIVRWRAELAWRFHRESLDRMLDGIARGARGSGRSRASVERTILATESVLDRVPGVPKTCLYRALARFATLRRCGAEVVFVMGLPARGDGHGHAWVELDGAPFCEDEDVSSMAVTFCYPPGARTSPRAAQRSAP